MAIVWFNENFKELVSTIQNNNITLNKQSKSLIENAYTVMLGLDEQEKIVHIKPLTKEESIRGYIQEKKQYKITIRSSYARISNKFFINEIKKLIEINDLTEPKKFIVTFDDNSKSLLIDLKRGYLNA